LTELAGIFFEKHLIRVRDCLWCHEIRHAGPKKAGGLGLRKTKAVNSAFLSKLTWKLCHEPNLWVTQMHAKYSINEHFFKVKAHKADS